MIAAVVALALGAAATPAGSASPMPAGVAAFVRHERLTRYAFALADLNGDGRPEALVYPLANDEAAAQGLEANLCGSGGCNLYVLALTPAGYRRITAVSIVQLPVRVLPTRSHGWNDLGVRVAGGGILPGYEARLRFDGRRYPSNPSAPRAVRLRGPAGRVVIATDPPPPSDR